jgi:hypothetical protein
MDDDLVIAMLPAGGSMAACGLRADLPKRQRRHRWADLGEDYANHGVNGIIPVRVQACIVCGKDKR